MRNQLYKLFLEHPASVGESYTQHLMAASRFSARMMLGGMACLLHAVFPFLCTQAGSRIINELHHSMVTHRAKKLEHNAHQSQYKHVKQ